MNWDFQSDRPIYAQLVEQIQLRIISGVYQLGERLPSVRELAAQASVNPNTMQKALSEMEERGLVFAQRTSGRFITDNADVIESLKESLAIGEIKGFLQKMSRLGIDREAAVILINNIDSLKAVQIFPPSSFAMQDAESRQSDEAAGVEPEALIEEGQDILVSSNSENSADSIILVDVPDNLEESQPKDIQEDEDIVVEAIENITEDAVEEEVIIEEVVETAETVEELDK